MNRGKKYLFLLLGFIVIAGVLGAGNNYVKILLGTGIGLYYPYIALNLQLAVFCAAGAAFGLEKLLFEKKQKGRWKFNLPRFLILGLPGFVMGLCLILSNLFPATPLFGFVAAYSLFVNLMQMLFGYTLITSFYKAAETPLKN